MQYLFFWFTTLYLTVSRFIYMTTNDQILFFLWLRVLHCIYVSHLYPFTVEGHLDRFHVLNIVNSAAVNTGVCMSFWITVFLGNVAISGIAGSYGSFRGFLDSSVVKNPPVMQETRVQYLGQEDLPEEGMATHSNILAWRIPWTEEPGSLQSMGLQRARHDWSDTAQHSTW